MNWIRLQCIPQQARDVFKWHLPTDEGLADAANENEGDASPLHFFVSRHVIEEALRGTALANAIAETGRQTHRGKMPADASGILRQAKTKLYGKIECHDHADGDRLAMQQNIAKACLCFQGVTEGMAEIQQRPLPRLAFIRGNDGGLGRAADDDRPFLRVPIAAAYRRAGPLQPCLLYTSPSPRD